MAPRGSERPPTPPPILAVQRGNRALVLGHRGASAEAPENTLAAFRLAMEQGADGVELDVWRCASGEVVVVHDEDTRRTAGEALAVPDASWPALRALDVGAWRGDRFRGERIPLLSEVLEALPGAAINVELKGRGRDRRLAEAAARVIRRAGAADRVIASSFHVALLAAFRRAAPEVARGFLFEESRMWRVRAALSARLVGARAVHPEAGLVTPARARRWRRAGLSIVAWTVDEAVEVERLVALGASALISNVPGAVARMVGGG